VNGADLAACEAGHTHPGWYLGCKQCKERKKHSLDPTVQCAARMWLAKLPIVERKLRIDSAKNGAAPGSRKATWGERGVNW
jgi:hypothetical protein